MSATTVDFLGPSTGPLNRLAMLGERLPADPHARRPVVHAFGTARPLHLGDYLGTVQALRALAADPGIDLEITFDGDRAQAASTAATLVACGLGSATFRHGTPGFGERAYLSELVQTPIGDLRQPRVAMGAVSGDARGVIWLLDTHLRHAAAVRAAHLDLNPLLGYDPQLRPGVSNLATILGGLNDRTPIAALYGLHGTADLRHAVTHALRRRLAPVQAAYADLAADPRLMARLLSPAPVGSPAAR